MEKLTCGIFFSNEYNSTSQRYSEEHLKQVASFAAAAAAVDDDSDSDDDDDVDDDDDDDLLIINC